MVLVGTAGPHPRLWHAFPNLVLKLYTSAHRPQSVHLIQVYREQSRLLYIVFQWCTIGVHPAGPSLYPSHITSHLKCTLHFHRESNLPPHPLSSTNTSLPLMQSAAECIQERMQNSETALSKHCQIHFIVNGTQQHYHNVLNQLDGCYLIGFNSKYDHTVKISVFFRITYFPQIFISSTEISEDLLTYRLNFQFQNVVSDIVP